MLIGAGSIKAMGMGMSMRKEVSMKMREPKRESPEERNERKRKERKQRRKILSNIFVDRDWQDVRAGKKSPHELNCIMVRAIITEVDGLLKDALEAGANPNCTSNVGRPLEFAHRASAIKLLLKYNANPKLCIESPIVRVLSYYLDRKVKKYTYGDHKVFFKKREQEQWRLANKTFNCVQQFLRKGVCINQTANGDTPVQTIMPLASECKLELRVAGGILRELIWRGASAEGIRYQYLGRGFLANTEGLKHYAIREREKYNATIGFLSCAQYEGSPVSSLPVELREIIGKLAKQGFEFHVIEEKVEAVSEAVDMNSSDDEDDYRVQAPAPSPSAPTVSFHWKSLLFSRKYAPQKIAAFCIAAGIAKFSYETWKKHRLLKKRRARRRLFLKKELGIEG